MSTARGLREDSETMGDGRQAWLTPSCRYFARRHGQSIWYYGLDKARIRLARAKCTSCGKMIESKRCGHFVSCPCRKSFCDTDRFEPERHRFGGNAAPNYLEDKKTT